MHRLLERLDGLGGTLVPLSYLVGLLLGTMAYFAGSTAGSIVWVAVGVALGSELHAFMQLRRARAAYAEYKRLAAAKDAGKEAAQQNFKTQVGILALLVAFQCFTGTGYAATNWHPSGPLFLVVLQLAVRGCIVPVLFLLSGFLISLVESPGEVLSKASQEILHYSVRQMVKHWRKRIKYVIKRGGDLSSLMVALLNEEGENSAARRTALIAANLQAAERQIPARAGFLSGFLARLRGEPNSVVGALLAPATENVATDELARLTMQNGIVPLRDHVTWVSDEEPPRGRSVTSHTHSHGHTPRSRRQDSGRSSQDLARKKRQLLALLADDPRMSLTAIQKSLGGISRPSAVQYRDDARRALWEKYPDRHAEFAAAWQGEWGAPPESPESV